MLLPCLVHSSDLRMEGPSSSETSVDVRRTTRRYVPEDETFYFQLAVLRFHAILSKYWRRREINNYTWTTDVLRRFEVLAAVAIKIAIFWNVTLCDLDAMTRCLHFRVRRETQEELLFPHGHNNSAASYSTFWVKRGSRVDNDHAGYFLVMSRRCPR